MIKIMKIIMVLILFYMSKLNSREVLWFNAFRFALYLIA